MALKKIISALPANFPLPILMIQHMPGNFTPSFAERLDQNTGIEVREARDGDCLQPGTALLAPGGCQLELHRGPHGTPVYIRESEPHEYYHPCADVTLGSIAECFPGNVLVVVLTGMGSDGKAGVEKLKQKGATVWAQSENSCIVFGMPKAVIEARLADRVLDLETLAAELSRV